MTATEELRRLLDERGVEWWPMYDIEAGYHQDRDTEFLVHGCKHVAHEWGGRLQMDMLTPEQVIAATLGDSVATRKRQSVERVYLVEVSDELIEGWCPLGVYLHKESAEDCAESYRREEDGVRQFARVVELKVEDT